MGLIIDYKLIQGKHNKIDRILKPPFDITWNFQIWYPNPSDGKSKLEGAYLEAKRIKWLLERNITEENYIVPIDLEMCPNE